MSDLANAVAAADDNLVNIPINTVKKHNNHTITLLPNWTFEVNGPEFEGVKADSKRYNSYNDAVAAINKHVEMTAISESKTFKHLPVLDARGKPVTIRGINRRDGSLLGLEVSPAYPYVTWIKKVLERITEIRTELSTLDDQIRQYRISDSRGYVSDAAGLSRKLTELTTEVEDKTAKAEMVKQSLI